MIVSDTTFAAFGRLAFALFALVGLAAAALVIASAFGALPLGQLNVSGTSVTVGLADLPMKTRLTWAGCAVLVVIVVLVSLPTALRFERDALITLSRSRRNGMIGGGSLAVSSRSLHALATFRAESVPGVLEAFTRLKLKRKGWYVDLQVVLTAKAEVQQVGKTLRTAMHEALRAHTGYPVARLRVWAQLDPLSKRRRVY